MTNGAAKDIKMGLIFSFCIKTRSVLQFGGKCNCNPSSKQSLHLIWPEHKEYYLIVANNTFREIVVQYWTQFRFINCRKGRKLWFIWWIFVSGSTLWQIKFCYFEWKNVYFCFMCFKPKKTSFILEGHLYIWLVPIINVCYRWVSNIIFR